MAINPYPETEEERQRLLYELAREVGERRFGTECRHDKVTNEHLGEIEELLGN